MSLEWRSPDELRPHPDNPREHPPDAVQKVESSIAEYGFTSPILVTEDDTIVAGHLRRKAAVNLEMEQVPVITLDLTEQQAKQYLVMDNRASEESEWSEADVANLVNELADDFGPQALGFSDVEFEMLQDDLDVNSYFGDEVDNDTEEIHVCDHCGEEFTT